MITLDSTGISTQTLDEILTETGQETKDQFERQDLNVTPGTGGIGDLLMVMAKREYDMGQTIRNIQAQTTVSGAQGQQATNLALITGTERPTASFSTVTLQLNLDPGTTVLQGSSFRVPDSQYTWDTLQEVSNLGVDPADFTVGAKANTAGPVRANAGTITESIATIVGLNTVTNPSDAIQGREAFTDQELLTLRSEELQSSGVGTQEAVDDAVRKVANVLDVRVLDPDSGYTHVVVWDDSLASNNDIAQAIQDARAYGVPTTGATSGTAEDHYGDPVTVNFDRATERQIFMRIGRSIDADEYPVDGDAQIKAAVLNFAATDSRFRLKIGTDVVASRFTQPVWTVSGVTNVAYIYIGFVFPAVSSGTLAISNTEIATLQEADIVVENA